MQDLQVGISTIAEISSHITSVSAGFTVRFYKLYFIY